MSYIKVWIHLVWSTKHREPYFRTPALRNIVFSHIHSFGRENDIYVDFANGYTDHVHVLIALKPTQCIADVAKLLTSGSSRWLKEQRFVPPDFAWQTDYYAASVSPSLVSRTRQYIKNQEVHHQRRSFADEHEELLTKWGVVKHENS
ncbi:transposase [Fibrella arboris]|uniref:transposase n=1 Tax=Fibrella arboris TaxID=3242486 RepID=UPI003522151B